MVVYGFLSYKDGCVSIPNKELLDKFADMLRKEPSLGYVHRLAKESGRMLQATKAGDDCIILELKVDHTVEEAIAQIKDRNYALRFQGRLGEAIKYRGCILAVGIAYNREDKEHDCRIEILIGQVTHDFFIK